MPKLSVVGQAQRDIRARATVALGYEVKTPWVSYQERGGCGYEFNPESLEQMFALMRALDGAYEYQVTSYKNAAGRQHYSLVVLWERPAEGEIGE